MQPPDRPEPGSPEDWLAYARRDLAAAQVLQQGLTDLALQSAFHAQQAAEKAVKAVLTARSIVFPLTHNIRTLYDLAIRHGIAVPSEIHAAPTLTRYAAETRYPGPFDPITETQLGEALRLASAVVDWAARIISPPADAG